MKKGKTIAVRMLGNWQHYENGREYMLEEPEAAQLVAGGIAIAIAIEQQKIETEEE